MVVGVGIRGHGHLTADARHFIERADDVVYVISDKIAERMVRDLRPDAESMHLLYQPGKPRHLTYQAMVERMLRPLRAGKTVCGAFYGHPGLCADSPHDAVEQARAEGHTAMMLPAVSSIDCLWADLGIDPTDDGVQIFEASRYLLFKKKPDVSAGLILLQIGSIGEASYLASGFRRDGLRLLAAELARRYGPRHQCVIYQVATLLTSARHLVKIPLGQLGEAEINYMDTLYLPPKRPARADLRMQRRLGL